MTITREDLIDAIAADLNIVDGMSTTNAAIAAIGAIEALGFVIVPRVPDEEMRRLAKATFGSVVTTASEVVFTAQWASAIAGSPLYREVKG